MRIMSVLAATGACAVVGWVCGLVPVWPVARLAVASVMGSFVGAVGVLVFVFFTLSRSGSGGLGAVSFGLSEVILLGVPTIALMLSSATSRFGGCVGVQQAWQRTDRSSLVVGRPWLRRCGWRGASRSRAATNL